MQGTQLQSVDCKQFIETKLHSILSVYKYTNVDPVFFARSSKLLSVKLSWNCEPLTKKNSITFVSPQTYNYEYKLKDKANVGK